MVELTYQEQVLTKTSTHIQIKKYIEEEQIVVGDLVIKEKDEVKEYLATDRYYPVVAFELSQQQLEDLK